MIGEDALACKELKLHYELEKLLTLELEKAIPNLTIPVQVRLRAPHLAKHTIMICTEGRQELRRK